MDRNEEESFKGYNVSNTALMRGHVAWLCGGCEKEVKGTVC